MTRVDPAAGTAKWLRNLSSSTQDITAGIARVRESPGVAAVRSAAKYRNNVQAAFPKWERRTGAVTLQKWQANTTAAVGNVASGAQRKQGNYQDFATAFYPYLDQGVAAVKAMPNDSFEARVQRAVAMMRHNAGFTRNN
jgi:hypothetical protein